MLADADGVLDLPLRTARHRSQHGGIVQDFVIEWYAGDRGRVRVKCFHVFVRRIAPPSKRIGRSAQLDAIVSRALSPA